LRAKKGAAEKRPVALPASQSGRGQLTWIEHRTEWDRIGRSRAIDVGTPSKAELGRVRIARAFAAPVSDRNLTALASFLRENVGRLLSFIVVYCRRVVDEVAQQNRVDDFRSGLQLGLRAQEASDRGDDKEAEVLYERALPLYERALGPEDLQLVGPLANLAGVYRALGKFDRAEVLYARVAFLMEEAFGPSDVLVGAALADTAAAVASQGQYGRAKNLYQRAFLIYQASLGPEDPRTVRLFKDFAELGDKLNRRDEAEAPKAGASLVRPGA
jgi:Tetratricopeptide repeat